MSQTIQNDCEKAVKYSLDATIEEARIIFWQFYKLTGQTPRDWLDRGQPSLEKEPGPKHGFLCSFVRHGESLEACDGNCAHENGKKYGKYTCVKVLRSESEQWLPRVHKIMLSE